MTSFMAACLWRGHDAHSCLRWVEKQTFGRKNDLQCIAGVYFSQKNLNFELHKARDIGC